MLHALALMAEDDPRAAAEDGARLVAQAQRGDRMAFGQLIETHYDFIYRVACKWCGRRNEAEDIAQDVCVKLASAIRQFDGRSAFTSWLYKVTLNVVRDHHRATTRHVRREDAYLAEASEESDPDQEDAVMRTELWAAVRRLPEQQRESVLLVYGEELSHAEAAAIMGIREGTVSSHIHDAKKALRGLL